MKKAKAIEIVNGESVFNLASSLSNDDWLRAARLLRDGKTEEFKKMDSEPMYIRPEKLLPFAIKKEKKWRKG